MKTTEPNKKPVLIDLLCTLEHAGFRIVSAEAQTDSLPHASHDTTADVLLSGTNTWLSIVRGEAFASLLISRDVASPVAMVIERSHPANVIAAASLDAALRLWKWNWSGKGWPEFPNVDLGFWVLQPMGPHHNGYADWPTFCIRDTPGNHCIAVVGAVDRATSKRNEANARLMCAAPKMLQALKHVAAHFEAIPGNSHIVEEIEAVIALAEPQN